MADEDQQLTLQERGKSSDYVLGLKEKQNVMILKKKEILDAQFNFDKRIARIQK